MTTDVIEDLDEGVATLTLNRPERMNALSPAMLQFLGDAFVRLDADPDVRVIVLTGAGRGFCSGGDVKRMAEGAIPSDSSAAVAGLRAKMETTRLLYEMSKPTIAMVNAAAAGAGLVFALACDLRIAGESSRFTTAFAKVGLPGDFGGSFFLTALLGAAKARELYFTSDVIDAQQALALGLVNRLAPDAELAAVTRLFARRLAVGPAVAYRYMKRNLAAAQSRTLVEILDLEAQHQIAASGTADHREAARAFVEKRAPVFRGR